MTTSAPVGDRPVGNMKRELRVTDAAAFSVGLIGPVGVMALLGAGAAGILGRAAMWAFVFALVAVALVAYGFVKLSRHISHTGSVYALVGVTLGPRAGFVAGWSLFFAYVTIGAGSGIEIGFFLDQLLKDLGSSASLDFALVFVVVLTAVLLLARREIHVVTRSLLTAELVGAVLVVLLDVVILVRLATGTAPGGRTLDARFLELPSGTGVTVIAAAAVFGFLAFAGFEGAAALGEEAREPRRDIPRAITIAIVVVGAFYLLTIIAQSLGYGTDATGVKSFVGAGAPYGDLGRAYVGPWLGDLLTLAAVVSLFAIFLGTLSAAGRILFALARDSGSSLPIARLSPTGAPSTALVASGALALVVALLERVVVSSGTLNATFYALTVGTIALLAAYVLATAGALRFLFLGQRRAPAWQVVVPVLALLLVLYTLSRNTAGVDAPYSWFPYVVLTWLVLGVVLSLLPGLSGRVCASLDASQASADAPKSVPDADPKPAR